MSSQLQATSFLMVCMAGTSFLDVQMQGARFYKEGRVFEPFSICTQSETQMQAVYFNAVQAQGAVFSGQIDGSVWADTYIKGSNLKIEPLHSLIYALGLNDDSLPNWDSLLVKGEKLSGQVHNRYIEQIAAARSVANADQVHLPQGNLPDPKEFHRLRTQLACSDVYTGLGIYIQYELEDSLYGWTEDSLRYVMQGTCPDVWAELQEIKFKTRGSEIKTILRIESLFQEFQ